MSNALEKVLEHPDKDEIISKLIIDIPEKDINEWLDTKYCNPGESKFVLSRTCLKEFKEKYLDIYGKIKQDILKVKESSPEDKLSLTLKNNKLYKDKIIQTLDKKIDIEEKMFRLVTALEDRAAETYDRMQNNEIDFKKDQIVINYLSLLFETLSKYYEIRDREEQRQEAKAASVTNVNNTNITIQVLDQQVSVFYDIFRDVLGTLDFETSMRCMELFNDKINKAKLSNNKEFTLDRQIAEVEILNNTIQKRLNE